MLIEGMIYQFTTNATNRFLITRPTPLLLFDCIPILKFRRTVSYLHTVYTIAIIFNGYDKLEV